MSESIGCMGCAGAGGRRTVFRLVAAIAGLGLLALLGGCASGGGERVGGAPEAWDPSNIPDAVPRAEPRSKYGNPATYSVAGRTYRTRDSSDGFVQRGVASWYGKQFHGQRTSSGERYNMYAMTAAHKTLPLPTYVRVTNLDNGRTAVVKVNDRGPFKRSRVIDLSYAAATKLGVARAGTAMVEIQAIDPAHPEGDPSPFLAANTAGAAEMRPKPGGRPDLEPGPRDRTARRADSAGSEVAARASSEDLKSSALVATQAATSATPTAAVEDAQSRTAGPQSRVETPASKPVVAQTPQADSAGHGLYLQVGAFGDPRNAERLRQRLVTKLEDRVVRVQDATVDGSGLYKVRIGPFSSDGEASVVRAKLETLGVERPSRVWN